MKQENSNHRASGAPTHIHFEAPTRHSKLIHLTVPFQSCWQFPVAITAVTAAKEIPASAQVSSRGSCCQKKEKRKTQQNNKIPFPEFKSKRCLSCPPLPWSALPLGGLTQPFVLHKARYSVTVTVQPHTVGEVGFSNIISSSGLSCQLPWLAIIPYKKQPNTNFVISLYS